MFSGETSHFQLKRFYRNPKTEKIKIKSPLIFKKVFKSAEENVVSGKISILIFAQWLTCCTTQ